MTLRVEPVRSIVEAAPGEVIDIVLSVVNDGEEPAVALATPIGLGDAAGAGLADQRFEIPARSQMLINVRAAVPATHGIGQHAEAVQVRQAGATEGSLVRFTLLIASVQRVTITPTPSPVRGLRGAKFDLVIVNNERHTVEFDLEAASGEARVRYEHDHFRLGPGERALTIGKVKHPVRWFGESVVHHVQLVARGRAESASAHLPFVQRPLIAGRLRSMVAALVVVALWASVAGAGIWWYRNRGDDAIADDPTTTLAPGTDDGLAVVDDTGSSPGGNGSGGDGSGGDGSGGDGSGDAGTGDGSGDGSGDAGSGDAGSGDAGSGGDGSGDAGSGDAGSGDAGSGDAGSGDAGSGGDGSGDAGSGDAGAGDGGDAGGVSAEAPTGGGTTGADDSPAAPSDAPSTAANTSVVRGTIDVDGGVDDVVVTPTPMSLQDIADADPAAFALAERSTARKIWSARYVPPEPSADPPSTRAIAAGPFAPDADGIWGVSLPVNQTYELSFRKPGFETRSFVVNPVAGEQVELDVSLEPASATISGVANGAGGRLENVAIIVTDGHVDYQTVTDDNGVWGIDGVASSPGYTVVGTLEGYGTDATVVAVDPGAEVGGVTLTLRTGRSVLAGAVVDANTGEPLGGATIRAVSGSETTTTTTLTDGDVGSFQLPQLLVGARYAVTAERTGYRTATTSAIVQGGLTTLAPLRLEPLAATISGTVTDAETGRAISAASVTLTRDDLVEPVASVQTVNDGGGAFTLGRVPPGQYLLTLEHWQHADVRHVLVVRSASDVVLDPEDPARAQTGPSFDLTMAPIDIGTIGDRPTGAVSLRIRDADETRECPTTSGGQSRPPEQCSAIFDVTVEIITTDQFFIDQTEAGEGPFTKKTVTTTDPATGVTTTTDLYVLRCEPDGECNSRDDFPDYTIRNIPVGAYTIRLSHPDYNSRTVPVTIRPNATAAETINMARLGSVIGRVLDASQSPLEVSILNQIPPVVIRRADIVGLTYPTRMIEGTFQTDDETLLPPGNYVVEVAGASAGFWIDADQDVDPDDAATAPTPDIDSDPTTVVFAFSIPVPDPDNPTGRTILEPIYAEPYPAIEARALMPTAIDPDITFGPLGADPTARLWCTSEAGAAAAIDADVSGTLVSFDRVGVATLDVDHDGALDECTMSASATGFETAEHTFGVTDVTGNAVAPLRPLVDRYVDIALLAESTASDIVRQPRGTLSWTDTGQDPDGRIPVPNATITPSNVITALVPADSTTPPGSGTYAVTPHRPTIAAITSELDDGVPPDAVWDFGPGVRQLIGTARFDIEATGYPGGTLIVTIDEQGAMTTAVEMDIASAGDASGFAIDMEPSDGTLQGQVTIWTSDPTLDYGEVEIVSRLEGETDPTLDLGTDGAYTAGVAAGTWSTEVTTTPVSNLEVVTPPTEDLTDCLPPGVAPVGGPTSGANTASFRQCVGPGAASSLAETTLVELGTVRLIAFDLAGDRIDDLSEFDVRLDGTTAVTTTESDADGPRLIVDGIDVPRIADPADHPDPPDAPAAFPSTLVTNHQITLPTAGLFDPTDATVTISRFYNGGPDTVQVAAFNRDLTTSGITLPFEPGAKYQIEVTLPSYGSVTGTIGTSDSTGGTPPICTDPAAPSIEASITAIPVVLIPGDGFFTVDRWVTDTTSGREVIESLGTCDDFVLSGKTGNYAIAVDQPEFVSDRTRAQLEAILAGPSGLTSSLNDFVVFVPMSGGPTDPPAVITDPLPGLTIRGTPVDLRTFEALDGAAATDVSFVVRDSGGGLTVAPATVSQTATEMTLDPDDTYTIEFRGCVTPAADTTAFDACDLRFPVSLSLPIDRTIANPAVPIEVDAEVVQVGGEITTTLLFENSRDRPVCPDDTYQLERSFDADLFGRVDGTDTTLTVDGTLRNEQLDIVVEPDGATTQSDCIAQSGRFTETFDEWIPTGTHTVTLPVIAGFGSPTLTWDPDTSDATPGTSISGTAVGTTQVAFDLTVTSVTATTSAVARYEALPRTVTLDICGQAPNGTADCDERFPTLAASLIEPGAGGATIAGSIGALASTGYPASFTSIIPDAQPHSLSISDELHVGAANQDVLVLPGVGTLDFADPFAFEGSAVRVGVRAEGLSSAAGTPAPLAATITVSGSNNSEDWLPLPAGTACTIGDGGGAQTYTCFTDSSYNDYLVEVIADGYIKETREFTNVKKGDTIAETVTLIKAATLTVNVTQYDSAEAAVTPFDTSLASLVVLQPVDGGGAIPIADSTGCAATAGCFRFLVEPGNYSDPDGGSVGTRSYRFETGSTTAYLRDESATITATVGGSPAGASLELRPRVITVAVSAAGLTVTGVDLTFGTGSAITDTTGPYRFTSLDATPIPLSGAATVLVRASDGRNVTTTSGAGSDNVAVTVLPYLTVTGNVSSWIPAGTEVNATSGGTTRTTTVQADGTYTFAGTGTAGGLDVNADGTSRTWTITLGATDTNSLTVTVASDTPSPEVVDDDLTVPTTPPTTVPPTTVPPTTAPPTTAPPTTAPPTTTPTATTAAP